MDEFFLSIRRAIAARGCAAPCRRLTVVQQALIFGSDFRLIYLFIGVLCRFVILEFLAEWLLMLLKLHLKEQHA